MLGDLWRLSVSHLIPAGVVVWQMMLKMKDRVINIKVDRARRSLTNNIIKDSQHGFISKRACHTNLFDFFNKVQVYKMFDNTKAINAV